MKAQDLRIGNYHYYHIVDKFDDPQERDEIYRIDADDLRILSENEDPDYRPIPLTEEWVEKLGFQWSIQHQAYYLKGFDYVLDDCGDYWRAIKHKRNGDVLISLTDVHTLQNLYFILTGEELKIKENEE